MTSSAWGLLALFLTLLLMASWPLGIWVARLCAGNLPGWMHKIEAPLYRLASTSPGQSMNWSNYALALLPIQNCAMLTVTLLSGDWKWGHVAVTFASSSVYALVALRWTWSHWHL